MFAEIMLIKIIFHFMIYWFSFYIALEESDTQINDCDEISLIITH